MAELELVLVARALVAPSAALPELLYRERARPRGVSPACAALIGDALAHAWPALWRRGGAVPTVGLDGVRGRPWQRHAPIGLRFSVATLELLRWLVCTPLTRPVAELQQLVGAPATPGDDVAVYLALAAADPTARAVIAAQPFVRASPLAWLGFADLLAGPAPGFDALCTGAGALAVEALTGELAQRWRAAELARRARTSPDEVIAIAAAQDAALTGFLAACERRRRRDLAGFVIDAAAPLCAALPPAATLDPKAPLARRAEARRASGALVRAVLTWARWDAEHRGVRFIDDDYAAAQVLLARFEPIGAAGTARAAAWLADLEALAPATVEAP